MQSSWVKCCSEGSDRARVEELPRTACTVNEINQYLCTFQVWLNRYHPLSFFLSCLHIRGGNWIARQKAFEAIKQTTPIKSNNVSFYFSCVHLKLAWAYRPFSHDVMVAMLVDQNKEMAAILVNQNNCGESNSILCKYFLLFQGIHLSLVS